MNKGVKIQTNYGRPMGGLIARNAVWGSGASDVIAWQQLKNQRYAELIGIFVRHLDGLINGCMVHHRTLCK